MSMKPLNEVGPRMEANVEGSERSADGAVLTKLDSGTVVVAAGAGETEEFALSASISAFS